MRPSLTTFVTTDTLSFEVILSVLKVDVREPAEGVRCGEGIEGEDDGVTMIDDVDEI